MLCEGHRRCASAANSCDTVHYHCTRSWFKRPHYSEAEETSNCLHNFGSFITLSLDLHRILYHVNVSIPMYSIVCLLNSIYEELNWRFASRGRVVIRVCPVVLSLCTSTTHYNDAFDPREFGWLAGSEHEAAVLEIWEFCKEPGELLSALFDWCHDTEGDTGVAPTWY